MLMTNPFYMSGSESVQIVIDSEYYIGELCISLFDIQSICRTGCIFISDNETDEIFLVRVDFLQPVSYPNDVYSYIRAAESVVLVIDIL